MGEGIRKFVVTETRSQARIEGREIVGGDIIEEAAGYRMSAMYWRIADGEDAPVPAPPDEVWLILGGGMVIRGGGDVAAHAGELLLVPAATPGTAQAFADTELLTVAYPPSWETGEEDWASATNAPQRGQKASRFAIDDVTQWEQLGSGAAFLSPLALAPGAPGFGLDVRFGRFRQGAEFRLPRPALPCDQLVVPTAGELTLRAPGGELTIAPGEFMYIPAGQSGEFRAAQDAVAVLIRVPEA